MQMLHINCLVTELSENAKEVVHELRFHTVSQSRNTDYSVLPSDLLIGIS